MDKKGVSQIITTILIILLVLAAIVIVWQAIKGTISKAAKGISADCITLDLEISSMTLSTLSATSGTCSQQTTAVPPTDCTDQTTCETAQDATNCGGVWTGEANADAEMKITRNTGAGDIRAVKILIGGLAIGDIDAVQIANELGTQTFDSLTIVSGDTVSIAAIVGDDALLCGMSDTVESASTFT